MKLAEALALRSDLQKKISSLRGRIANNAVVQEGDSPKESPDQLLKECLGAIQQYRELVVRINLTNTISKLPDGRTLTEAIAQRDELAQKHSLLQHTIENSHKEPDRYSMAEIKWISCLDIKKLQDQSEDLSKNIRELNLAIQETNWKIDLE